MSGEDVKARADVATGTGGAHGAPTRIAVEVESYGPMRLEPDTRPGRPGKTGRRPGTIIENDEQVRQAVLATRRAQRRPTMRNVAANGGTFTYSNLRYYLSVTRRTWHELLHTF